MLSFLGTNQAHGCCAKTVLPAFLQAIRGWQMMAHATPAGWPAPLPGNGQAWRFAILQNPSATVEAPNTCPQTQHFQNFHWGWHWAPTRCSVPWDHCRFRYLLERKFHCEPEWQLLHLEQKKRVGRKNRDAWGHFLCFCLNYKKCHNSSLHQFCCTLG